MTNWKQHHADEAEKGFEQPLVKSVVEEFVGNVLRNYNVDLGKGLGAYGLHKCMAVAMQIARAEALGFDPELLRLNDAEVDEAQLKLARMAVESGKPIWAILDESSRAGEG